MEIVVLLIKGWCASLISIQAHKPPKLSILVKYKDAISLDVFEDLLNVCPSLFAVYGLIF